MNTLTWLLVAAIAIQSTAIAYLWRERARLVRRLALTTWRADHDPLTHLGNRYLLQRTLATWQAGRRRITVAMIDLDDLHGINNRFGYATGDILIRFAADRLRRIADHSGGIAVRLGGDEFVVAWPDLHPATIETAIRGLFQHLTTDPIDIGRQLLPIEACIGVATTLDHHVSQAKLLARADQARAHGKRTGKNQWVMWNEHLSTAGDDHTGRPLRRLRDRI